ncbi:DUF6378 domain-containing protein [Streptomyces smyrnaeus]|uniref:DUF6378 domain-containing protein n=1 Tax=Streptomyces smyrnaeus TaxID=1387713 RepID=UPI0036CCE0B9
MKDYKVFEFVKDVHDGEKGVVTGLRTDNAYSVHVTFGDGISCWFHPSDLDPWDEPEGEAEAPRTAGAALVYGERRQQNGDPWENFNRIACLWSSYLGRQVSRLDVAMMMILLKVSREKVTHDEDNLADIEGYAECARIIARKDADN